VKRLVGFDITDSAELPDGGPLVLERRFRYNEGVKMRIRRVAASEVKPGALIEGQVYGGLGKYLIRTRLYSGQQLIDLERWPGLWRAVDTKMH